MIFAALSEAASRGELLLVNGGLCRFHQRKDGVVVIREIIVLPAARRLGIGRRMIRDIQAEHSGATLRARCPAQTIAGTVGAGNVFWKHLGFTLRSTIKGINLWERPS